MATSLYCFMLLLCTSYCIWADKVKNDEKFLWLNSGESFTMRCSTTETDYDGLYLLLGLYEEKEVFFLFVKSDRLTIGDGYDSRLQTEGNPNDLTITLSNMTVDDSGVYWCRYRRMNKETRSSERFAGDGSTMVAVNGRPCKMNTKGTSTVSNLVVVSAISAGSVFLLCLIVLFLWLVPRMKKMRKRRVHARRSDSVYEDMRKSSSAHKAQPTNHFT